MDTLCNVRSGTRGPPPRSQSDGQLDRPSTLGTAIDLWNLRLEQAHLIAEVEALMALTRTSSPTNSNSSAGSILSAEATTFEPGPPLGVPGQQP